MPPSHPQAELAHQWLDQAQRDLRLARLAALDASLSGLAAFHCQQAAEKAFKAFMALRDQPLRRTHDLPALLAHIESLEPEFAVLRPAARILDVYLVAGRYPDAGPVPLPSETEQALVLAEQVVAFVHAHLP